MASKPKSRKASKCCTRMVRLEARFTDRNVASDRVIKTRRVVYRAGNVGALLKAAAKMNSRWNVVNVDLLVNPELGHYRIGLSFGRDTQGVSTTAYVSLESADVPVVAAYLFATMQPYVAMAHFTPTADGGDGEELPLPTISAAALAEMAAVGGVQ